jgi:hypothetical protein
MSIDELNATLDAIRRREHRAEKFQASLKGINLDDDEGKSTFEEVETRAKARLAGMTPEELELKEMGISIETE